MPSEEHRTEDPRVRRLRTLATSSIVGADIQWLLGEYDRLREGMRVIAEGTLCPDLFPKLDLERDAWEIQARTAMVSAIAVLEHRP